MKHLVQLVAVAFLGGLVLTACGPTGSGGEPAADQTEEPAEPAEEETEAETNMVLTGVDWELASYSDAAGTMADVLAGSRVTARFDDDQVNGTAGCNSYFGPASIEGDTLTIGPLGSTLMACAEPLMNQEQTFLANLESAKRYAFDGQQLVLSGDQGQELLRFDLVEPVDLAGTSWQVVSYNNGRGGVVTVIIETEGQLTATFGEDGQVSGSAGCNSYFAGYEATAEALTVGQIGVTEMFCDQPEGVMTQESEYLAALGKAATYRIDGDRLEIRSTDGALQVSLVTQQPVSGIPAEVAAGLANAAYAVSDLANEPIQLANGEFRRPAAGDSASELVVTLLKNGAFGYSPDGQPLAAGLLAANSGGSGTFVYLVALRLSDSGQWQNRASLLLGDRVQVSGLALNDEGQIVVELIRHDEDDPLCCPTLNVRQTYDLHEEELILIGEEVVN